MGLMTPDFGGLPRCSQPLAGDLAGWMGRRGVATPPIHFLAPKAWSRRLMMAAGLLAGESRCFPGMASRLGAGLAPGMCRGLSRDCPLTPLCIGGMTGLLQGMPLGPSASA